LTTSQGGATDLASTAQGRNAAHAKVHNTL
jgi:hypothetical protein